MTRELPPVQRCARSGCSNPMDTPAAWREGDLRFCSKTCAATELAFRGRTTCHLGRHVDLTVIVIESTEARAELSLACTDCDTVFAVMDSTFWRASAARVTVDRARLDNLRSRT